MQALTWGSAGARIPLWLRAASAFGVLWNVYGVVQWAGSFQQTPQRLIAAGMTAAQAETYLSLPAWVGVAFGIGVIGGLLGSLALAARYRAAQPILAASLVGYGLLFAADAAHGVFASLPAQLAILAFVVVVAVALLAVARLAAARGLLR